MLTAKLDISFSNITRVQCIDLFNDTCIVYGFVLFLFYCIGTIKNEQSRDTTNIGYKSLNEDKQNIEKNNAEN
jgi:hypothetical protein